MPRDEDIELVKSQVNMRMLAEHFGIRVNRKGMALCPFHSDKNPSMKIHKGYLSDDGYYCWACGSGGTIFNFVMKYCNVGFEESVKYIAGVFGIQIADKMDFTADEKAQITHQKQIRELDRELKEKCLRSLSLLSDKIRFYEKVRQSAEPFGGVFCWISNRLPTLQGQWDTLYEVMYGKEGVMRHG